MKSVKSVIDMLREEWKRQKKWKIKIGTKNRGNKQKTETNMIDIITLNVNCLDTAVKIQIVTVDQKTQLSYLLSSRNPL